MQPMRIDETERALLAIIRESDTRQAQEIYTKTQLVPSDFSNPAVGALWEIFGGLLDAGFPIDLRATLNRAAISQAIQAAGGETFVRDWFAVVQFPSPRIAAEHAKTVLNASLRRRSIQALGEGHRALKDATADPLEALKAIVEKLQSLHGRVPHVRSASMDALTLAEQLEEAASGRARLCIPTGIVALDNMIGGLQSSVLTMLGALPGVGKSALLASLAYSLCERKVRVGFLTLEDESLWLTRRWSALHSGVPLFKIQTGSMPHWEREQLGQVLPYVQQLQGFLAVTDKQRLSLSEVIAAAHEMVLTHKVEVIILDHLGEIQMPRSERYDLDVADALSQLRGLAKHYKIPVVVAAHVRRRQGLTDDAPPSLTDFANSSAPERMARVALGLSKHEQGVVCTILKQTNGPAGESIGLKLNRQAAMVQLDGEFAI